VRIGRAVEMPRDGAGARWAAIGACRLKDGCHDVMMVEYLPTIPQARAAQEGRQ